MQIFEEVLFFKLRTTIQQKTVKQTCVSLMLRGGGRTRARNCLTRKRKGQGQICLPMSPLVVQGHRCGGGGHTVHRFIYLFIFLTLVFFLKCL